MRDAASPPTGHRRGQPPTPTPPRLSARTAYRLQRLLAPNPFYRWFAAAIESVPPLRRLFTAAEETTKGKLFGCRMCGQCALPVAGYACPMSCPKQLRNGPCGGVGADGSCEVHPERRCVWVTAYERSASQGRAGDLGRRQHPIDQRRWGESSWLNYWQGRDEGLWTDGDDRQPPQRRPEGDGQMSSLRRRLAAGEFAVTAEIGPPRGADAAAVRRKAELLRGWVDAANITDNQGSHVRLAAWAGSVAVLAAGVDPVMQLTCRDRNRIALQSDLLGASAVGIPNVLLLTGDHPRFGDHAAAKPVFDLDSVQLLAVARAMRDERRLLSGRTVDPPPEWLIGAVENPFAPPRAFRAERLGKKVAAGAEFVQTQFVFDVPAFATWLAQVRDLGWHERCHILAGVGAIRSLRALDYMRRNVPGVHIPDEVDRRLRGVPAARVAAEGRRIAAELVQRLAGITGVAGVHIIAFGQESAVPEILERAGVGPRGPLPDSPESEAPVAGAEPVGTAAHASTLPPGTAAAPRTGGNPHGR